MGKCQQVVCVTVDDAFYSVTPETVEEFFNDNVKGKVQEMIIQVCVGSSCHLKGSAEIVELFQKAVEENHLENEITLAGSFCIGKCNRVGVTVQVDDDIHTGITRENFKEFFRENVLTKIERV